MLNVPYQKQQNRRWCGSATLEMVLAYYGLDIDQRDIASEVIRNGRSFADDLSRYATSYGFEVLRIHGIEDQPAIYKLSELINSGIPPTGYTGTPPNLPNPKCPASRVHST